jgi:transcriptional regulator with XRE-family HTH domain
MSNPLHHFANDWHYPAKVPNTKLTTMAAVARNLRTLMEREAMTQLKLAKKSGVSQRTISNVLNESHEPGVETVDQLARVFKLDGWQLQMPDLPPELLGSELVDRTVGALVQASPKGREMIADLAEREAHYSKTKP